MTTRCSDGWTDHVWMQTGIQDASSLWTDGSVHMRFTFTCTCGAQTAAMMEGPYRNGISEEAKIKAIANFRKGAVLTD